MADRGRRKRRKRKDSTTHLKPPLDFIESPLDGRKHYCTPVQAARKPFLASSLPVDDEEAMKWVSLQLIARHRFCSCRFKFSLIFTVPFGSKSTVLFA